MIGTSNNTSPPPLPPSNLHEPHPPPSALDRRSTSRSLPPVPLHSNECYAILEDGTATLPPALPRRNTAGPHFNTLPAPRHPPFSRSNTSPMPLPLRPGMQDTAVSLREQVDRNGGNGCRHFSLSALHEEKQNPHSPTIDPEEVLPYEEPVDALNKMRMKRQHTNNEPAQVESNAPGPEIPKSSDGNDGNKQGDGMLIISSGDVGSLYNRVERIDKPSSNTTNNPQLSDVTESDYSTLNMETPYATLEPYIENKPKNSPKH